MVDRRLLWLFGALLAALLFVRLCRIAKSVKAAAPSQEYLTVLKEHEASTAGQDPLLSAYDALKTHRPKPRLNTGLYTPTPEDDRPPETP